MTEAEMTEKATNIHKGGGEQAEAAPAADESSNQLPDLLAKIASRIAENEALDSEAAKPADDHSETPEEPSPEEPADKTQPETERPFANVEAALARLAQQVEAQVDDAPSEAWSDDTAETLTTHCEDAGLIEGRKKNEMLIGTESEKIESNEKPVNYVYLQPDAQEIGQKWFENRFEELAKRFDAAATGGPTGQDGGYAPLLEKFDALEARLGALLGQPAEDGTMAGGALHDIELCIAEIANQLEVTSHELKRIDGIEGKIGEISQALASHGGSAGAKASNAFQAGDAGDVGELSAIMKDFMRERRNEGEHANSVLDTMQQTIIRLLDRMEALESKGARIPSSGAHQHSGQEEQAAADTVATGKASAISQGAGAATFDEFDVAPGANGGQRTRSAQKSAQPEPADAPASEDSVSLDRLERAIGELEKSDGQPEGQKTAAAPRNRADFIAAARQAAAKAGGQEEAKPILNPVQAERAKFAAAARAAAARANAAVDNDDADMEEIEATNDGFSLGSIGARLGAPSKNSGRIRAVVAVIAIIAVGLGATKLMMGLASDAGRQQLQTDRVQKQGSNRANGQSSNGVAVKKMSEAPQTTTAPRQLVQKTAAQPIGQNQMPGAVTFDATTGNLVQQTALSPETVPQTSPSAVSGGAGRHSKQVLPSMLVGPLSLRLAAANGNPSAEFQVAARFADGKGVQQNFDEAVKWYGRSASRGFALAQYRLGTLHERGLGLPKDVNRARVWYQRAAANDNIKAMHNLAVLSASPKLGKPDYETAAAWFTKAAERGLADSQFNLAILYQNGLGVPRDPAMAYKWFSLAALSGDGEATKRMAGLSKSLGKKIVIKLDRQIEQWRRKPSAKIANDPHYAGQAWQRKNG
jgi:localization factor PodJL